MSKISQIIRGASVIPVEKRMVLVAADTAEYTTDSTSVVDLVTLDGFSIAAETPILLVYSARKTAGGAHRFSLGLKLNATVTGEAMPLQTSSGLSTSGASDRIEQAHGKVYLPPRVADYLAGTAARVYWTMVQAEGWSVGGAAPYHTAEPPTVPITEITIRGIVGSALITGAVKDIYIYTLPTEVS